LSLVHAGRGGKVLEEFVEPDLPRLYDDARVDFVLDHLHTQAAELVDDELVEIGRHDGLWVRAVARSASGQTVVGIVIPDGAATQSGPDSELLALERAFGAPPVRLVYGLSQKPEQPLHVELIPEGRRL
jgi:hypothetical protein